MKPWMMAASLLVMAHGTAFAATSSANIAERFGMLMWPKAAIPQLTEKEKSEFRAQTAKLKTPACPLKGLDEELFAMVNQEYDQWGRIIRVDNIKLLKQTFSPEELVTAYDYKKENPNATLLEAIGAISFKSEEKDTLPEFSRERETIAKKRTEQMRASIAQKAKQIRTPYLEAKGCKR